MSIYQVKFYDGDYKPRQQKANADKAKAYVEHHFNSSSSPSANYTVVIVGSNASTTSKNWGRWYASAISREFNTEVGGDNGIKVGGFGGRGDGSVKHTNMPAILLESLFVSNPTHAAIVRSDNGQDRLAQVLVESIQRFFPAGGLIAFSVGHKGKNSNPSDRGADVVGGGSEADYTEKVLKKAETMLLGITAPVTDRRIRVMKGGQELFSDVIDEDAELLWDPVRGLLQIVE